MAKLTYTEAKKLADEYLNQQDCSEELAYLDEQTLNKEFGWVFFYTTKKYLETRDFRDSIGGNAPIIIDKHTGKITVTGTAFDIEHYINEYTLTKT